MTNEKLQESINAHIAELLADRVLTRLTEALQEQWSTVITELIDTRKTNERLKAKLETFEATLTRVERLVQEHEDNIKASQATQRKAAQLIDEALTSLSAGE